MGDTLGHESPGAQSTRRALENALERLCESKLWVATLFILASSPGVLNAMHITSYVFLSEIPAHYCSVPELLQANWTAAQIRNISNPMDFASHSSCYRYAWNYSLLAALGYEGSYNYTQSVAVMPTLASCSHYSYEEQQPQSTIVSQWNLVCEHAPLRSMAQIAIASGKFIGAFIFGLFADKFGRKRSFTLAAIFYMVFGPLAAFTQTFMLFLCARLLIGIAGSGVYESGYTILTELLVTRYRTKLGCIYNLSYPIGLILLPWAAYYNHSWRHLQLIISLPALLLLIHCWYLPESPRWLFSQGRGNDAWRVIHRQCPKCSTDSDQNDFGVEALSEPERHRGDVWHKRLVTSLKRLLQLFANMELCRRALICYFTWFVASLSYYAIALNGANLTADPYYYVALNGVAEAPGYFLPIPLLMIMGRKATSAILFFMSSAALLSILLIPYNDTGLIMGVALTGRLCICAVFAVIILHTSELFPTVNRNTAIGTCLTMSQLGSIAAPYIVDMLGAKAWYIPSTICGCLALLSALLILLLPETKNKPLTDTIQQLRVGDLKDRVSIGNCCSFR